MSESDPQNTARTGGPDEPATATASTADFVARLRQARQSQVHYDPELRFEDGTILVKAQNTIFQVYKGPLVQHSPIFRDMFALPQPQTDDSGVASGPVTVPLFDSSYDVRCLLKVLMPRRRIRLSDIGDTPCDELCACLRMAHKYEMDELLHESLWSLRKVYPDTYTLFKDRRSAERRTPARAISVVNLARLVEAPSLLPMAIAECCTLGSKIVDGYTRPDLTVEHLSPSDMGICFQAKDKLIEARVHAFQQLFDPKVRQRCTAIAADNVYFNRFYSDLTGGAVPGLYTPNVWDSFSGYMSARIPGVCESCKQAFIAEDVAQQKRIFDGLPALLGIAVEGWGTPPRRRWHPFRNAVIRRQCGPECRGHS